MWVISQLHPFPSPYFHLFIYLKYPHSGLQRAKHVCFCGLDAFLQGLTSMYFRHHVSSWIQKLSLECSATNCTLNLHLSLQKWISFSESFNFCWNISFVDKIVLMRKGWESVRSSRVFWILVVQGLFHHLKSLVLKSNCSWGLCYLNGIQLWFGWSEAVNKIVQQWTWKWMWNPGFKTVYYAWVASWMGKLWPSISLKCTHQFCSSVTSTTSAPTNHCQLNFLWYFLCKVYIFTIYRNDYNGNLKHHNFGFKHPF